MESASVKEVKAIFISQIQSINIFEEIGILLAANKLWQANLERNLKENPFRKKLLGSKDSVNE